MVTDTTGGTIDEMIEVVTAEGEKTASESLLLTETVVHHEGLTTESLFVVCHKAEVGKT